MNKTTERFNAWVKGFAKDVADTTGKEGAVEQTVLKVINQGSWKGAISAGGTLDLRDSNGMFTIKWENLQDLGGVAEIRKIARKAVELD